MSDEFIEVRVYEPNEKSPYYQVSVNGAWVTGLFASEPAALLAVSLDFNDLDEAWSVHCPEPLDLDTVLDFLRRGS